MDVHYKFSKVTFRDAEGRVVARERLDHTDRRQLLERLVQWPQGIPIVLEASFGWGWLSDLMLEAGLEPQLSNCYKVKQMRKARGGAKTNKMDADLQSLLPMEVDEWWRVWMAPPEVRDRRERLRFRADLVRMQTQTKNRVHAIFHRHGIFHEFSDLFGTEGRRFLKALCAKRCKILPPGGREALGGQMLVLDHVQAQLRTIKQRLEKELEATPLALHLKSVPGFGLILSHVLISEIGDIWRFGANHKRVASYSLLAPIPDDTGDDGEEESTPLGRHLGQRGNRTLKWAFIEAAHAAVRAGGRWRAMFDRHTQGGKKNRNRGYIKVARELVKVVTAVWRDGRMYSEEPPSQGASKRSKRRRRRNSRSGTGRPCQPMVVAQS
jgi:transposase